MAEKKKLGEMLMEAGLIDTLQLDSALGHQRNWGGKLGSVLVELGFITEENLAGFIEKQLHHPCVGISSITVPKEAVEAVKTDIAKKYTVFPINLEGNTVTLAMMDPTDLRVIDELQFVVGKKIKPALALESEIKKAIRRYYEGEKFEDKQYRIMPKKERTVEETVDVKGRPEEKIFEKEEFVTREENQATKDEPKKETAEKKEKKEIPSKMIVEALSALLIEKGIIKREELLERIKKQLRK
ncbi:MAG: hypothetical protein AABY44_08280 [Nitrospirota bacterium]